MKTLLSLIKEIKKKSQSMGILIADYFPNSSSHLIAVNNEDEIILFINFSNKDNQTFTSSKGRFLEVDYDVKCDIKRLYGQKNITQKFCVLKLNKLESDNILLKYFLNLCIDLITKLGEMPEISDIYTHIENTKRLFEQLTQKTNTDEVGLWGELFLITKSKELNYIIDSWHIDNTDRFDFNDGRNKIEIKTTTRNSRTHHFSLNQLDKMQSSNVIICSIMTSKTGLGITVFDLYEEIISKVDYIHQIVFKEKMFKICGDKLPTFNTKLDLGMANSSYKFYSVGSIPSIDSSCIESGVSNVEFDSDLQTIAFLDLNNFSSEKLFSLFN